MRRSKMRGSRFRLASWESGTEMDRGFRIEGDADFSQSFVIGERPIDARQQHVELFIGERKPDGFKRVFGLLFRKSHRGVRAALRGGDSGFRNQECRKGGCSREQVAAGEARHVYQDIAAV